VPPNQPLHLTVLPQGHRSIIEWPDACGRPAGEWQGVRQTRSSRWHHRGKILLRTYSRRKHAGRPLVVLATALAGFLAVIGSQHAGGDRRDREAPSGLRAGEACQAMMAQNRCTPDGGISAALVDEKGADGALGKVVPPTRGSPSEDIVEAAFRCERVPACDFADYVQITGLEKPASLIRGEHYRRKNGHVVHLVSEKQLTRLSRTNPRGVVLLMVEIVRRGPELFSVGISAASMGDPNKGQRVKRGRGGFIGLASGKVGCGDNRFSLRRTNSTWECVY
jgi:hypothetical protein